MKNTFALAMVAAFMAVAGSASAFIDIDGGNLQVDYHFNFGVPESVNSTLADIQYGNVTNFLGAGFRNGGSAVQSGNTITKMICDDITPIGTFGGQAMTSFTFSVANFNTASVSVRPRVRLYQANGTNGGPGTYITGWTFNPYSFSVGITTLTAGVGAGVFMPSTTFWAGIVFDNNTGTTGATLAQMDNLGVGLFNPPTRGSSVDGLYATTAAGSFVGNNPAGAGFTLQGIVANAGWEFQAVPEPGTMIALGAGLAAVAARRRRK